MKSFIPIYSTSPYTFIVLVGASNHRQNSHHSLWFSTSFVPITSFFFSEYSDLNSSKLLKLSILPSIISKGLIIRFSPSIILFPVKVNFFSLLTYSLYNSSKVSTNPFCIAFFNSFFNSISISFPILIISAYNALPCSILTFSGLLFLIPTAQFVTLIDKSFSIFLIFISKFSTTLLLLCLICLL